MIASSRASAANESHLFAPILYADLSYNVLWCSRTLS